MILDIIIPQYNETEEQIKVLLDSISNQENIDFKEINVCIVNDCSNVILSDEFLKNYEKLNICYIKNNKNTGPGLARQKGVDLTDNQYIMFCDADDKLYNNKVLSYIIPFLKQKKPNYLVTNIAAERYINGKKCLEIREGRDTFPWMHGKVYKRSFLEEKEIRFSPYVRHVEDVYFTTCVIGSIDLRLITYLDCVSYLWKANEASLTRKKSEFPYMVEVFDDFISCPKYISEFLNKHKSYYRFSFVVNSIFGLYICLNSDAFDDDRLIERKEKFNEILKGYIDKKRNIFVLMGKEELEKMYNEEKKQLILRNNLKKVYKTVDDFLKEYIFTEKED